jgi:hypothetical protein
MMDLDQQVQQLINQAPMDQHIRSGVRSIAPVLKRIAQTLPFKTYYLPQSNGGDWLVTTIQNCYQSTVTIDVIYLFADRNDGLEFSKQSSFIGKVESVPIIQFLFEVSTIESIDRVIFFNQKGNLNQGQELDRTYIQTLINEQLEKTFFEQTINNLPPDIC